MPDDSDLDYDLWHDGHWGCPACGETWCSGPGPGCPGPRKRTEAPSLPMDLCSEIPEDDR